MRILLVCIFTILLSCASAPVTDGGPSTIEGQAYLSRAGLVVSGVLLVDLPERDAEKLAGKVLRVKGFIEKEHPWKTVREGEPQRTGFDMPVMRKIASIEMLGQ